MNYILREIIAVITNSLKMMFFFDLQFFQVAPLNHHGLADPKDLVNRELHETSIKLLFILNIRICPFISYTL